MRIKSSTILRSAVPLALGLMSMNATAAGPMSSYVPLKAPCQVLDTGTDGFKYIENGSEEGLYRVWAGKDKDGVFHGLKGQGGMDKCVNPMPGMHPTAVVIAVSPRANNGARGNLAVYGEHIKSDDVFGKESTINFWNTNSTNTTIVRVGPHSDKIKIRAKLFATTEAGKKLKLKVTGNVLGFFYENKKNDKHHMEHVIHVGRTGSGTGDYDDILKAMDSIRFSGDSSKWLVKLGPGNFDLGKAQLMLKPYVRIEGSGRHITKIFGDHGSDNDNDSDSAMVVGVDKAVLANLTIKNKGKNDSYDARIALYNNNASPTLDNVRIYAHGTANRVCGVSNYGDSAPQIFDSEIEGINNKGMLGAGLCNHDQSEPQLVDVRALGSGIINGYGLLNAENARPQLSNVHAIGSGVKIGRPPNFVYAGKGVGMQSFNFARPVAKDSVFEGDISFVIANNDIARLDGKDLRPTNPFPVVAPLGDNATARATRIMYSVVAHISRDRTAEIVDPWVLVPVPAAPPAAVLAATALNSGPFRFQCNDVIDLANIAPGIFPARYLTVALAELNNPPAEPDPLRFFPQFAPGQFTLGVVPVPPIVFNPLLPAVTGPC